MRTAVFCAYPLFYIPVAGAQMLPIADLASCELSEWDAILVVGSGQLDEETRLAPEVLAKLWAYVENGGLLYAELIEAFDFTSSRLFAWKQDFPKTRRTTEKLRVSLAHDGTLEKGALLEWSGACMHGFAIDADPVLEFGAFRETRLCSDEQAHVYPGLHVKRLGAGKVVYASFSLLSSRMPEALRPYRRWQQVIGAVAAAVGIPLGIWPKVIDVGGGTSMRDAVERNVNWFRCSGMLPADDGRLGVYENIHSVTGRISADRRPDCHAHTALMFHLYGRWKNDPAYEDVSRRLLQYLFDGGYQDMDPASPSYGFFKWFDDPRNVPDQMFTDDNAWVCLVLLYLYRHTGRESYRERGLRLAEALLATQNEYGLRPEVLRRAQLAELGHTGAARLPGSMNPHFESIAHAAYIQAYLVSGREVYLNTAMAGSLYMLRHWNELKFMYSRTSGLVRFLLPLGYLIRHDETGEIAAGIARIIDYLLSCQSGLGGIEETDNPDPERFGREDAGVFVQNGEGIADQLYTNNFLLMNVWELWKSGGDERHLKLYDKLSDYMCRIQIASSDERYNGGWMRAYDLRHGEYFGNNGDTGWGPYCMESGWTNAISSSGLLLGLLNASIYE